MIEKAPTEDELLKLTEENDARERRLIEATNGQLMPNPIGLSVDRVRVYLEHLLADRGLLQTAAMDFERWRTDRIAEAETAVARAKLLEGAPGPRWAKGPRVVRPQER